MTESTGSVRITGAWLCAGLLLLAACKGEQAGPSSQDFSKSRAQVAERAKAQAPRTAPRVARPGTAAGGNGTQVAFGNDSGLSYDGEGKRDPFRSFEWERLAEEREDVRGPLEQFEISQLSLVAVVWNAGRPRALVQDPSGQTYIIAPGTRIGKNLGRVLTIGDNSVLVKETYVDLQGQETTKEIELSIRRSQGG